MATNRSRERVKFRYGQCLNESCEKHKEGVLQIPARNEFVCPECGKPLRETRPPKKKTPMLVWVLGGVGIALVACFIVWICLDSSKKEEIVEVPEEIIEQPEPEQINGPTGEDVAKVPEEKVKISEEKVNQPMVTAPSSTNEKYGTVNIGYGKYTGDLKDGKPNGHGTVVYSTSQKIVPSQSYIANPGDKVEADWRDGKISGGFVYWYHDGDITTFKY